MKNVEAIQCRKEREGIIMYERNFHPVNLKLELRRFVHNSSRMICIRSIQNL